jgi:hypothetical protein
MAKRALILVLVAVVVVVAVVVAVNLAPLGPAIGAVFSNTTINLQP